MWVLEAALRCSERQLEVIFNILVLKVCLEGGPARHQGGYLGRERLKG